MRRSLILVLTLACLLLAAVPALAETDFMFDRSVTTVFEGDTLQLKLLRQNGALADETISYASSAPRTASVDQNGVVTGNNKGTATISASMKVGKRTYKATLNITVLRPATSITVEEKDLTVYQADDPRIEPLMPGVEKDGWLQQDTAEMEEETLPVIVLPMGRDQRIMATVLPRDASNRKFTLTVSDDRIVKAIGTANLRPVSTGVCVLTVASETNPEVSVRYRLLVTQPVKSLTLDAGSRKVGVNGTLQVTANVQPANATISGVEWSCDQPRIATVDEYGVVTGLSKGTATIRARSVDGSKRAASVQITVVQQPTGLSVEPSYFTVAVGSYRNLRAVVEPANANDKAVVWSSSDESVARVNANGRVTPVARGNCMITCTSKNFPEVFTSAFVTVTQPVTKIAFTEKTVSVDVGSSTQVFWNVEPWDVSDGSVTLKSSNEKVVRVDQTGMIYGVKRGSANITATANDGSGRRASISVNVLQPVYGVHMKNDTVQIDLETPTTLIAELEPSDASNTNMTWRSSDPRIATVSGKKNRPVVTGHAWGTVTITGITEDGGYPTEATVKVGNYDKALSIQDLYTQGNKVKISIRNDSNLTIVKFDFTLSLYDIYDQPLVINSVLGGNYINGYYAHTLYEFNTTTHGRFVFSNFIQPEETIGRVELAITKYYCDDGFVREIRADRQPFMSIPTDAYVGPLLTPEETDDGDYSGN